MYYSFTITDEKVTITNVNKNAFTNDIEMNGNPKLFDTTKILPVLDESLNYTIINSLRTKGLYILDSEITSFNTYTPIEKYHSLNSDVVLNPTEFYIYLSEVRDYNTFEPLNKYQIYDVGTTKYQTEIFVKVTKDVYQYVFDRLADNMVLEISAETFKTYDNSELNDTNLITSQYYVFDKSETTGSPLKITASVSDKNQVKITPWLFYKLNTLISRSGVFIPEFICDTTNFVSNSVFFKTNFREFSVKTEEYSKYSEFEGFSNNGSCWMIWKDDQVMERLFTKSKADGIPLYVKLHTWFGFAKNDVRSSLPLRSSNELLENFYLYGLNVDENNLVQKQYNDSNKTVLLNYLYNSQTNVKLFDTMNSFTSYYECVVNNVWKSFAISGNVIVISSDNNMNYYMSIVQENNQYYRILSVYNQLEAPVTTGLIKITFNMYYGLKRLLNEDKVIYIKSYENLTDINFYNSLVIQDKKDVLLSQIFRSEHLKFTEKHFKPQHVLMFIEIAFLNNVLNNYGIYLTLSNKEECLNKIANMSIDQYYKDTLVIKLNRFYKLIELITPIYNEYLTIRDSQLAIKDSINTLEDVFKLEESKC
jgi:hypothetical protein